MSEDADSVSDHPFAVWDDRPTLVLTPATTEFIPRRVLDCLTTCHHLTSTDEVLEWRAIVENGECRYTVSASEQTLKQLESALRQAMPGYTIERADDLSLPELDEESLTGIRFRGEGTRRHDWQTGLWPTVTEDGPTLDSRPALTAAIDRLAEMDATVVYQTLITSKASWKRSAEDRIYRLKENRDTVAMRFVADLILPTNPEKEVEPDPEHQDRIDLIEAANKTQSFTVAARAVADGPDAEKALDAFWHGMMSADGPYYKVGATSGNDTETLVEEMAEQRIPTLSLGSKIVRWAFGSDVKPTFTMDPRTLAHSCFIEGAKLTDKGQRLLSTTPEERRELGAPVPELLSQYEEGFTLGVLETPEKNVPNIVAVPPLMQRMHLIVVGKSGSGKSSLLVRGMLDNQLLTDGPSIFIDPKGDGMPTEYMRAHYAKHKTLDNVLHFDCAEMLPALSFFDVRPYLDDGIARATAVEDIADHYIELVRAMMGAERFDRAVQSPAVIRYLIKALFDPVHGQDAFSHRELQDAAIQMKATGDAPPVTDAELEAMLSGITSNNIQTFEIVMGGVETRINEIPGDSRLAQLFNHVPEDGDPHFDFYDLLDEDTMVIFDTSSLRSNARDAMTLVLLSNLWAALKRRASEQDEADRKLVNLYLEEAADVGTSDIVTELLSQGRGFGLSMTLAMQFPEQLRDDNPRAYAEVLNNVSTIVSGNVSVDSVLPKRFATADMSATDAANRLRALKRGEWLVSLPSAFDTPEPRPFTLNSAPLPDGLEWSENPLTPGMETAFESAARFVEEDTFEQYGIDTIASRQTYENVETDREPSVDANHGRSHVLEHTKRLPEGIEWDSTSTAFVCTHCDARYETTREGILRAVDCCYGLGRIDRDDVPLCSLRYKLSSAEATATGYTHQQLSFLQAVYNAHQQRFDTEWEYDIVYDSMVRLQEYTGIEASAVRELIDDGVLAHDCDRPQKLYTVTAAGRETLNESHRLGIAHGDGRGDLGESSLHVAMVEVLRRYLEQLYRNNPNSRVSEVRTYHDLEDGMRLDVVGLDDDGDIVVVAEAERVNHDVLEAAPSDFDKIAGCDPEEAIWLTESRDAAHTILKALNDPKRGPPRLEETYSESYSPQRLSFDTSGITEIHTVRHMRDSLLEAR
ncbi:type IV secretory system conjugative DNA transfer family protein [Halomarina rubra]|uniref:Type IV secretory system conjugative DNA transfer family protein n=1 Tax=Halomarina rubra TaxID=2071873 RepID=A0ABD6AXR1_9EURY|nr:type IV secretory system conjugative DNA transfer family protein [Halomarina rubra]